jgi:hypothetical protein
MSLRKRSCGSFPFWFACAMFLSATIADVCSAECERLSDPAGATPSDLVTYRLDDLSGVELLGLDGSRVRASSLHEPVPELTRTGVMPPVVWANLIDVALYHNDRGTLNYQFASHSGHLRLCRLEAVGGGRGSLERLEYDEAGYLIGWQRLINHDGKWQAIEHRCFGYTVGGLISSFAKASVPVDCRHLDSGQIQQIYVRESTGRLTRVIDRDLVPRDLEQIIKATTRVILFDGHGVASHIIETDRDGDPIQFPVANDGWQAGLTRATRQRWIKITGPHLEVDLYGSVISQDLPDADRRKWDIVLVKRIGPGDDPDSTCLMREIERPIASGKTDARGRIPLTDEQQSEIWAIARSHPDQICLRMGADSYSIRAPYPKPDWIRCLDPKDSHPLACPTH